MVTEKIVIGGNVEVPELHVRKKDADEGTFNSCFLGTVFCARKQA